MNKETILIIIAQIFGLISIFFVTVANVKTKKKEILFFNGIANVFSCIQYCLLGAWTGAVSTIIAATRNAIFSRFKDNNIPLYVLIIYLIIVLIINGFIYTDIISLIPIFNVCIFAYGLWQKDVGRLKIIMIIVGLTGVLYDTINLAFVSVINQSISAITGTIGYIRYRKEEKSK